MEISIRQLTGEDIVEADAILMSAFSPPSRAAALRLYLDLQPDGFFLAVAPSGPVGMVGAVDFGAFAYIGLMAVHPQGQRQGIGLALMQHLLGWIDGCGVPAALLDASEAGYPLYRRLGFVDCDRSLVFQYTGDSPSSDLPAGVYRLQPEDLGSLAGFDAPIFGADRAKVFRSFLDAFPDRAFLTRDPSGQVTGFLFAQEQRLGPWVAARPQDAGALLRAALTLPFTEAPTLVVPGSNTQALGLLERSGFQLVTAVHRHMQRGGSKHPGQRELIYSQASFAIG